jgi:hypothetical protein
MATGLQAMKFVTERTFDRPKNLCVPIPIQKLWEYIAFFRLKTTHYRAMVVCFD